MRRLHFFLTTTLLFFPFAMAHSQFGQNIDARKLSSVEKRRIIDEAQDPKLRTLREETALLLDIYGVERFIQRTPEGIKNAHSIESALLSDMALFPERLIQEVEAWQKSNPLRIAAAVRILANNNSKLNDKVRERLWQTLPALRKHDSATVRRAGLTIVFLCQKLKDTYAWFADYLTDMEVPEGDSMPIAGYAITGITTGTATPNAVEKIVKFLDSPNKRLSSLAAMELPHISRGNEKLRLTMTDLYENRILKKQEPLSVLLNCYPDLFPDPKRATAFLVSVYKESEKDEGLLIVTLRSIVRVKGAQSQTEGFLRGELLRSKNEKVLQTILDFFATCDRVEPQTVEAVAKLRRDRNEFRLLHRADQIISRNPSKE